MRPCPETDLWGHVNLSINWKSDFVKFKHLMAVQHLAIPIAMLTVTLMKVSKVPKISTCS